MAMGEGDEGGTIFLKLPLLFKRMTRGTTMKLS